MGLSSEGSGVEGRFATYVEHLASALGHADRVAPFRGYCTGLVLPGDRKSVEPMAARVEPGRVGAAHQSLHHFVAKAAWDDTAVLSAVRDLVLPALQAHGVNGEVIFPRSGDLKIPKWFGWLIDWVGVVGPHFRRSSAFPNGLERRGIGSSPDVFGDEVGVLA
ncbi:MAG: transposase [Azospirillaceae bacterium]|nr:transposase [Azospirillaceae bacterium]